jgi:subtilase family serine protease
MRASRRELNYVATANKKRKSADKLVKIEQNINDVIVYLKEECNNRSVIEGSFVVKTQKMPG